LCIINSWIFAGGGRDPPTAYDAIDYITISSLGNAADFGDLTLGRQGLLAAGSNSIRGVLLVGHPTETYD
jgi:hypothetical protein